MIRALIDTKLLNQCISEIRSDYELKRQLEQERKRDLELQAQIAELQKEKSTSTKKDVKAALNALTGVQWFNKGYREKDDLLKVEYYAKAITLDSDYAFAYRNRGLIHKKQNRYQAALEDYDKAISLDPNYASAYNSRGNIYYLTKHYKKARADYNKAVSIEPDNDLYRRNIKKVNKKLGL